MKTKQNLMLAGVLAAFTMGATGAKAATNLLTNGSFEDGEVITNGGDTPGWSGFGASPTSLDNPPSYPGAEDGAYFESFSSTEPLSPLSGQNSISQIFSDTAGQAYQVSFYLADDGQTPNEFVVQYNGNDIFDGKNLESPADVYQKLTFAVTGTGSDTLTFGAQDVPGYLSLDNVSVTASSVSAAPEPSTWLLMFAGLGGIGLMLRRAKKTMGFRFKDALSA